MASGIFKFAKSDCLNCPMRSHPAPSPGVSAMPRIIDARFPDSSRCRASHKTLACQIKIAATTIAVSSRARLAPAIERNLHRIVICYEGRPLCKLYLVSVKGRERRMHAHPVRLEIFALRIPVTMKAAEMACDAGDVAKAF